MKRQARNTWLIARTILLEAVRRRELYVIVLIALALLAGLRFVTFFQIQGLSKFYREISLRTMNTATALVAILLAARQLPREFKNRTLYPLLAKPITRLEFILGKFYGVLLASAFCYLMFLVVFCVACISLKAPINYRLFAQGVYLEALCVAVVTAMTFLFSLLLNIDAAITISTILFLFSQVMMNLLSFIYDQIGPLQQKIVLAMHYIIPQLTLFDLSGKITHNIWGPISARAMGILSLYAVVYILIYMTISYLLFRRRPI